jgi:hypothetical protein
MTIQNANKVITEIRYEDELPSLAGEGIRTLFNLHIGYREMGLIKDWLNVYLEMSADEKDKIMRFLTG